MVLLKIIVHEFPQSELLIFSLSTTSMFAQSPFPVEPLRIGYLIADKSDSSLLVNEERGGD